MDRPMTPVFNGTSQDPLYTGANTPRTPVNGSYALTEYTANPTPPSEPTKSIAVSRVPEAFLLPNGYPDVWSIVSSYHGPYN